jgi:hypothetical protein
MKKKKDRVIALDYFRGICILIILLSHSAQFSYPIAYLSGMGLLWTSAAEMFFLLSGITLGVVRNDLANQNFKLLINKCWHRAATIYVLYIVTVIVSMSLGLFLTGRGLNVDMVWSAPKTTGMHLIFQILNFSYISGLAAFLMYYSVFMIFAPFLIYAIKTRLWPIILLSSGLIYTLGVSYPLQPSPLGIYGTFATWQIYFVIGIVLARFRQEIIHWFYSLPQRASKLIGYSLITVVGATS